MVSINRILCPVDFSEYSRHAFNRAVAVARNYLATISVLHVLPVPSAVPAIPYGPEGPGPLGLYGMDRREALAELSRFLGLGTVDVPVESVVVEAPAIPKEVLAQTQRLGVDLVVMGTHGRSGFDRLMLGSVAETVLRNARKPVLTVPPHVHEHVSRGRDPFERILYATDFSPGSGDALRYAASLAEHGQARLTLMHVVEPIPIGNDPMVGTSFDVSGYHAALEHSARERLRSVVPESVRFGCETEDVIVTGRPYVEILRVAAERAIDLVVVGVHGRNALDRLVFGSTTEHLIRRAACPVLTVPLAQGPAR